MITKAHLEPMAQVNMYASGFALHNHIEMHCSLYNGCQQLDNFEHCIFIIEENRF